MASAQVVAAEPVAAISPPFPGDVPAVEAQVVLQLVVDASGHVESAVVASRLPADALRCAARRGERSTPRRRRRSTRRHSRWPAGPARESSTSSSFIRPRRGPPPPPTPSPASSSPRAAISTDEQDEDYAQIEVHGPGWASPRGIDPTSGSSATCSRLLAAPADELEMLSAAPCGFFRRPRGRTERASAATMYLRGLRPGARIGHRDARRQRADQQPRPRAGPGVRGGRELHHPGGRRPQHPGARGAVRPPPGRRPPSWSAYFDLGVADRGSQAKASFGSFDQVRVVGIAAPREADEETFVAFAARKTSGFGQNRASESGTMNSQYSFEAGPRDHIRLLATAYWRLAEMLPRRAAPGRRRRRRHRLLRQLPVLHGGPGRADDARHRGRRLRSRGAGRLAVRVRALGHVDRLPCARELHGQHLRLADRPGARRRDGL